MTYFVMSILIGCLSVMAVRGKRGKWPQGMPVTRPRLVAVGGTYEGSHRRASDAYVIQERLVAVADGAAGSEPGHTAAALALGAVVAAGPQHARSPRAPEQDLGECAQAAHRAVRSAALRDAAMPGLVSTLDVIVLDPGESPRLRFAHVGDGAIWHCPRGGAPTRLTTSRSADDGPPCGLGLPAALEPEVGAVPIRPGDRVIVVTDGVVQALGARRMTELFATGSSPVACLDRLYDELAAAEPKEDATVIIADVVTV
ncbi:PP2C family protein-serine/threonine phosphatase [Nonomuraea sp. SYSU D8015]|uniref:PP2C family protein-serine/threonine phosphatase n=1 Tax=Nonomuraea sp. SYSU D8015 TaxID=2593644 RepID=UPI0016605505|nr:protein phosphatase 2C domain-containing protein [Nonomuraea sp. SYSU D8015]